MGLDWNPASKPKDGYEKEFEKIVSKLLKGVLWGEEKLKKRFDEISIPAFESLDAPMVGRDKEADIWISQRYDNSDKSVPLQVWIDEYKGYKVFTLVENCPGIPTYSSGGMGYVEAYSFRADFLKECEHIIGPETLNRAFEYMPPEKLLLYGNELLEHAHQYAEKHQLKIPESSVDDMESDAFHLHVIQAAGEWAIFWASKGHGLEPYF